MAGRDELYVALRNADAAGDAEGAAKLAKYIQTMPEDVTPKAAAPKDEDGIGTKLAKGAAMGVADIGNTALNIGVGALTLGGKVLPGVAQWNRTRNADMDYITEQNKDSTAFDVGRIGANVAATLPVGGALGKGAQLLGRGAAAVGMDAAVPVLNSLGTSLATSGMKTGAAVGNSLMSKAADMGIRTAGGAITGGVSAGLVNPESAPVGAVVGGALPGVLKGAGLAGGAVRKAITGEVAPEVAALAARAKELGITIPADRITNSKPMNALAATLNYVPMSGRAATETRMESQLNKALSRTFGQDSDNVTMALRKASDDLGGKFDSVLKNNVVRVDDSLLNRLTEIQTTAERELGADGLKAVSGQIDELLSKGATGELDGQAAYNIKRTLDRIGKRNAPEAYHALELKGALMEALDRSLGQAEAAAFKTTRQQYGNMLSLEKIAQNGAEGGVSVGRMANMKNINNPDLQELADIAAQFVKTRESQHGAMQRAVVGGVSGVIGGVPTMLAGAAAGRAANTALNSNMLRNALTGAPIGGGETFNKLLQGGYRAAPVLTSR